MANDFDKHDPNTEPATSTSDSDALNAERNGSETDEDRDPFEELASEFSERYRNGEMPSVEEYVEKCPEMAEEIRDLFPTIAAMEQLKERKAPAKPAAGGLELEQLGDFRILGEIGRGGMGVVYEAEQVSLGRHVAVKVLPKQALLDERHLRRFEREAQTAAKLHHTNIVPVFGVGQQDGFHYIVMQFISGVGLDEILIALRTQVLNDDSPAYRMDSSSRASHANHNAKALLDGNFTKHAATSLASSFTKDTKRFGTGTNSFGGTDATMELANTAVRSRDSMESAGRLSGSSITNGSSDSEPSKIKSLDEDNSRVLASLDREYYQSVAKIGQQVSDALAYAHEQGTLHRDIKPGNLLLDGTGTVWVADFGLAKLAEQDNVSRTGDIVGTLSYMPPESFSGDTDARGDIYALGLTLYEMLAMRPAYFGRDRAKLVKNITEGDLPRLSKLNPSIPRDLETIVLKAIAHRPEDRYATARELEEDMQSFLTDMPIKARRMSLPEQFTRWCRKNKMVASLSAAVLSLLLLSSITFGVMYDNAEDQRQIAVQKTEEAESQREEADAQREKSEKNEKQAVRNKKLADDAREEADAARAEANEIMTTAIGELFKRFNDIVSERLPLTTDQSLAEALSDGETEDLDEGELDPSNLTGDEESVAVQRPRPITAETAIQAEKFLKSFEVLASSTKKVEELAPMFADLTIRVGKIQRILGNNAEALEKFDDGIEKYEAIVDRNPSPSAIIGLANSYNEKGDVLAFRNPREAYETFDKALKLFEKHEDRIADSARATYERARMLFLMSMRPGGHSGGPGPGGPGAGGHRGGRGEGRGQRGGGRDGDSEGQRGPRERRDDNQRSEFANRDQSRMDRLQEAIQLLTALDASETNPEYRYLLARCHTAVAMISRRDRTRRTESANEALTVMEELVKEQPAVADYSFELVIAKFFSIENDRLSIKEEEPIVGEIVELTTKITKANPASSSYAILHLRALLRHAETADKIAKDAERKEDDDAVELRKSAEIKTHLAMNAMEGIKVRFSKNETMASYFPTSTEIETIREFASVKRIQAEGKSLSREGKETEALAAMTAARNALRRIVDRQIAEIRFAVRPQGPRLSETMSLLCKSETTLSGKEAIKPLLKEIVRQRIAAAKASRFPNATESDVAETKMYAAHFLYRNGDIENALELINDLKETLHPPDRSEFSVRSTTDEERAKKRDRSRIGMWSNVWQNDATQRKFLERGTLPFGRGRGRGMRSSSGRGGERGPDGREPGRPKDGQDQGPPPSRGPREAGDFGPPPRPERE